MSGDNIMASGYYGVRKIEKEAKDKSIIEPLLNNEESAKLRAISEFLNSGFDKQVVEFETYFVDLKINDVIIISAPDFRVPKDLTKNKFIVKKITHYYKLAKLTTKIKAIRYD